MYTPKANLLFRQTSNTIFRVSMLYTVIVPVARVGKIILLPLSYMATTCWHSGANVNVNMCEGNVRFKTILFYRHKIYLHIYVLVQRHVVFM